MKTPKDLMVELCADDAKKACNYSPSKKCPICKDKFPQKEMKRWDSKFNVKTEPTFICKSCSDKMRKRKENAD